MDARSACFWGSSPADCVRMVQFTDSGFYVLAAFLPEQKTAALEKQADESVQ